MRLCVLVGRKRIRIRYPFSYFFDKMQIFFDKTSALNVEAQDTVESVKMGIEVCHCWNSPVYRPALLLGENSILQHRF